MNEKTGPCLLVERLVELCKARPFDEKWLVAPSRLVGYQWLDAATRFGANLLNVRIKTLSSIAMDLAAPEIARRGATVLGSDAAELLVGRLFARLRNPSGYLGSLTVTAGLTSALHRTVADLRLAGISSSQLPEDSFEVKEKGLEIRNLLAAYEGALNDGGMLDRAGVLRLAIDALGKKDAMGEKTVAVFPSGLVSGLSGLERDLWDAIPEGNRESIEEDERREAAKPSVDGTARLFSSVGEINEVREVLRRCAKDNVPLDDVEIVCVDPDTYVPAVYETFARLTGTSRVPATFAGGIPVRYSRPARALMAWVSWVREGFPQRTLVQAIQDGLLKLDLPEETKLGFVRVGQILREVRIGMGEEKYSPLIADALESLEERHEWKRPALEALASLVNEIVPDADAVKDPVGVLKAASAFLENTARVAGEPDGHGRRRLANQIGELAQTIEETGPDTDFDPWPWLTQLALTASAGGSGPRPGCVHVSSPTNGGHSGRGHTFVVGLDDARFPGAGSQDPLLLDAEREGISDRLLTSGKALTRKVDSMLRLLARLRGKVTLSYCAKSLDDDRSIFPAAVFVAAYRILSGNRDGDHEDMLEWLPDPSAFAPVDTGEAMDPSEWWISKACGEEKLKDPDLIVADGFPHLGNGMIAAQARSSDLFTEYDGHVPEAGADFDPFRKDAGPMSASRLEKMGASPLDYFFSQVLRLQPIEEYCSAPDQWLDAASRGTLLHDVFREFMFRLRKDDLLPDAKRDGPLLNEVLQQEVAAYRAEYPPPSEEIFAAEVKVIEQIARVFLIEEEIFCRTSVPRYFEVAIGMGSDREGTPLDTPDAVAVSLPDGKSMKVHGRIDRIDEVAGSEGKVFTLWDYKTGSAWKCMQGDKVHWQGRVIQNYLYSEMVARSLKKLHPGAKIASFGYFFPGLKEHGLRIDWTAGELAGGKEILLRLGELLAAGCFPSSDSPDDLKYSDARAAHVDVDAAAAAIREKLMNADNEMLKPFALLRGFDWGWEDDR